MSHPPPSFLSAVLAVLSAFVGIRRSGISLAERGVRPIHIVVAGVLCASLLVATLITIVRLVLP